MLVPPGRTSVGPRKVHAWMCAEKPRLYSNYGESCRCTCGGFSVDLKLGSLWVLRFVLFFFREIDSQVILGCCVVVRVHAWSVERLAEVGALKVL